ncbi:MalY/PatB family protein [Caproiciproducens faecalis]|uniref:cysteine-S-conjugate beta-lyase n=1 Tax=Caproiciproducens faecalis TaxID=2820301 RepID=A0ABS7DMD3_9FIRM|nr:PatB family C-S lyase [Caproiciproducens faecalis]MBW7572378.1 PatB family C-S lyase [Caproiciproducens faecalis]
MTDFNLFPDRYAEKCRKWDRAKIEEHFGPVKDDFIPMWIADMDFRAPEPLVSRLHQAVENGIFGYTYVYDEFYDAVIRYFERHHHSSPKREWLTLCYGTVSTLHYTVQAFCQKGDYIMLSTPVYDPFERAATAFGAQVVENELVVKDNRYQIDFEKMEEQLKQYRPKLYMLCNPHNPSGRIWSREELVTLISLCQKYGTVVVADEVHSGMILDGVYTSTIETGELLKNVILLSSPNKQYNLGGLKTSYAIIQNEELRKTFRDRLTKNSITSPTVFGILALITCYNEGEEYSRALMGYLGENYRYAREAIENRIPKLSFMEMESSYLLWVNIQNTKLDSDTFTHRLAKETGVLVESGNNFVGNGEGYIRINLGTQFENVKEAFTRIEKFVNGL